MWLCNKMKPILVLTSLSIQSCLLGQKMYNCQTKKLLWFGKIGTGFLLGHSTVPSLGSMSPWALLLAEPPQFVGEVAAASTELGLHTGCPPLPWVGGHRTIGSMCPAGDVTVWGHPAWGWQCLPHDCWGLLETAGAFTSAAWEMALVLSFWYWPFKISSDNK